MGKKEISDWKKTSEETSRKNEKRKSEYFLPLESSMGIKGLNNGSCVNREVHAQFCEGLVGKFHRSTRQNNKEELYVITCEVKDFGRVRDAFYTKFGEPELARLSWQPKDLIEVSDKELIDKLSTLVEELEDNDDVQYVEGNFIFADKL